MPKDILYTKDGDIATTNGDITIGESTEQHKYVLLLARKGDIRLRPDMGVGVEDYANERDVAPIAGSSLATSIRRQFTHDGMNVKSINPVSWKIEASYVGSPNQSPLVIRKVNESEVLPPTTTAGRQSVFALAIQNYGNIDAFTEVIKNNDFTGKMNQPESLADEVDLSYAIAAGVEFVVDETSELRNEKVLKVLNGTVVIDSDAATRYFEPQFEIQFE